MFNPQTLIEHLLCARPSAWLLPASTCCPSFPGKRGGEEGCAERSGLLTREGLGIEAFLSGETGRTLFSLLWGLTMPPSPQGAKTRPTALEEEGTRRLPGPGVLVPDGAQQAQEVLPPPLSSSCSVTAGTAQTQQDAGPHRRLPEAHMWPGVLGPQLGPTWPSGKKRSSVRAREHPEGSLGRLGTQEARSGDIWASMG